MYTTRPGLILGFHGCDKSLVNDVLTGKKTLQGSENEYDWLGHGVYFWENSVARAYDVFHITHDASNFPQNRKAKESDELMLRELDCAVIETVHTIMEETGEDGFDSVRGVFFEGAEIYPRAGFREKDHIQICIKNPNCIKGYFLPRELDKEYNKE
jgi:hypothetical protein